MKKLTKIKIWVGVTAVLIYAVIIILKITREWSNWVLLWTAIPLILLAVAPNIRIRKKPEEKKEDIPIQLQQEFAINFLRDNQDLADHFTGEIKIVPYTPKQEGENKLTVNKVRVNRYWNEDIVYMALSRQKLEVIMYWIYEQDDDNAEENFNRRIDNAVLNPERLVEYETIEPDPTTGQIRTIRKKTPISYVKLEQEKAKSKEIETEEGVA